MAIKPRDLEGPFTKPLKKKRFRKEAKAALRLAYGKAERGINKEIKGSRMQQRRIGDWFDEYDDSIGEAAERTSGAYGQATQAIQQNSAASANYAEQLRQRMATEAQEDAARRGVAYDPSGSYTAADANLARLNSANVLSGVTGAQGASQAAMFADKSRIGERESIEQRLREQSRRRALQQEKRDMAGDKAAAVTDMWHGARDSERDFYLGLKAAAEPGKERKHARKQASKDRKLSRSEAKKDRRFEKNQAKKDRKQENRPEPASPADKKERREDRRETRADIQRVLGLLEDTKPKKQGKYANDRGKALRDILNSSRSFDRKEARKGYKKWKKSRGGDWWNQF